MAASVKAGMASTVLLGNRLRRAIRVKVWPALEEAGFGEFGATRAYRRRDGVIEVVEFTPFALEWREPRWLGGEARANGGSFMLHVGTYYVDVDQLPWAEAVERPKAHQCHRCVRLSHGDADSAADGRTFWPGADGERLDEMIEMALQALQARGLAYLDGHRDAESWIEGGSESKETVELTADEAAEMMRICREGRNAKTGALDGFHRRHHLADDRLDGRPCGDVLAGLLIGRGRVEEAMECLEGPKQERLREAAAR